MHPEGVRQAVSQAFSLENNNTRLPGAMPRAMVSHPFGVKTSPPACLRHGPTPTPDPRLPMRVRHKQPTLVSMWMLDVFCCALGCVTLLFLLESRKAGDESVKARA